MAWRKTRVIYRVSLSRNPTSLFPRSHRYLSCVYVSHRIMDDFSRRLCWWRTPVSGPLRIVANLAEWRKRPSPPRSCGNLLPFLRLPDPFSQVSRLDNFLVIRSVLAEISGSPCQVHISISSIAIARPDTGKSRQSP